MIAQKNDIVCEFFPVGDLQANCTLVYSQKSKEAVLFDAGNDYRDVLKKLTDKKLKLLKLMHTHAHFDHIGSSNALKKATGAPMVLHRDDLPLYKSLEQQGSMFAIKLDPCGEIDEAFNDGDSLNLPDGALSDWAASLEYIHTPGHSAGGTCFYSDYFETPVLIAGDTLFQGSIGRTDLPGGNYKQLMDSIKNRLFTLPKETIVITGHGPATTIGQEIAHNPFTKTLI